MIDDYASTMILLEQMKAYVPKAQAFSTMPTYSKEEDTDGP